MASNTACDDDFIERQSDLAIAREFARRFPTITLEYFDAQRKGRIYVVSCHSVSVSGTITELLRVGLLQEHMIPPGRKRYLDGDFGTEGRGSSWIVKSLKGGRLRVLVSIMGDDQDETHYRKGTYRDDLPAAHPLQFCHPRHWPFGDARELRAYFEEDRALARTLIKADLTILRNKLGGMRKYGYSVHAGDGARMQYMVRGFAEELLRAFDDARVVSEQAPQLRLIDGVRP